MATLRIGKDADSHKVASNKLSHIRSRLMSVGREESEKDSPGNYALAMEAAIAGVFESIPDLVEDAFEVLDNPPSTWHHYMAMHDGQEIYEMEFGELREAVKRDLQSGKSELHVHKEMTHVLAAAMYMALIDDK